MQTQLMLSIGNFPPLSARGCVQELMPLKKGEFQRNILGDLIYIPQKGAQKYKTKIVCQDKTPFSHAGLMPGVQVKVSCIHPIWQRVEKTGEITLEKEVVNRELSLVDEQGEVIFIQSKTNTFKDERLKIGCMVSYLPVLDMCVLAHESHMDEWNLKNKWVLEMEEV